MAMSSRNDDIGIREGEKEEVLQVVEDVDTFLRSGGDHVPDCVHVLPKLLERIVDKYNDGRKKLGEEPEDDKSFLNVVERIFKLSTCDTCDIALDQTSSVLEKAMSLLEKDLCSLLEEPKQKAPKKSFSFGSRSDLSLIPSKSPFLEQDQDNHDFPFNFSSQKISILNKITTTMITTGYQIECCMTFANFRRSAFTTALQRFGHRNMKMEDVYKMPWESLEGEITTWNQVIWHCTTVLFNTEQRLYDSVP